MKVKIKDLHSNPFRKIESYPVNEQKVNVLMDSIKQTGFWDNILARQHNGEIQIAYGHHRLEALKRVFPSDFEVDIPVKNLDDETMIKIMASENMEDWAPTPSVINQTVKVTREFLLANPNIARKYGQVHKSSQTGENLIGAVLIANFLNWKQTRVSEALERLHIESTGEITQMTIEGFETEGSVRAFVDIIKKQKKAGNPIPKEKHKEIVQKFRNSKYSKKVLKESVQKALGEKPQEVEKKEQDHFPLPSSSAPPVTETEEVKSYQDLITVFNDAERMFKSALQKILSFYGNSGGIPEECRPYHSTVYARLIVMESLIVSLMERLAKRPDSFDINATCTNEKEVQMAKS